MTSAPRYLVGDVQLAPAVEVPADTTLAAAAARMMDAGVTAVLIVDEADLHLLLTERDVLRAVAGGLEGTVPAIAVATPHPIAVGIETRLLDAFALMLRRSVRDLPVVDRRREVVGLLTVGAALRTLVQAAEVPTWLSALRVALHMEVARTER